MFGPSLNDDASAQTDGLLNQNAGLPLSTPFLLLLLAICTLCAVGGAACAQRTGRHVWLWGTACFLFPPLLLVQVCLPPPNHALTSPRALEIVALLGLGLACLTLGAQGISWALGTGAGG